MRVGKNKYNANSGLSLSDYVKQNKDGSFSYKNPPRDHISTMIVINHLMSLLDGKISPEKKVEAKQEILGLSFRKEPYLISCKNGYIEIEK